MTNFYRVEEALRKLKVRFDAKMIHNIMQEERGAALRLLYQLKLSCARLSQVEPADHPDMMSMTGLKNGTMHKVMTKKNERTLEQTKSIPAPTKGGKDVRTAKQKRQDNRTLGYDVAQKTMFEASLKADADMHAEVERLRQEQRHMNQTKLRENQTFMKEWAAEGKKNWREN